MQTDSLFSCLFQTLPQLLFDLIEQPSVHAALYRFASVELKQTAFRPGGIFRVYFRLLYKSTGNSR